MVLYGVVNEHETNEEPSLVRVSYFASARGAETRVGSNVGKLKRKALVVIDYNVNNMYITSIKRLPEQTSFLPTLPALCQQWLLILTLK